jgi:hypothetical protein
MLREADIIDATGHEIRRIDVTKDLDHIHEAIDEIVELLCENKLAMKNFKAWDLEAEFDPKTYIERGYIDLKDDVAFRTMIDAVNSFVSAYKRGGMWKGGVKHPRETGKLIWFPKLYKNAEWRNTISDDELIINELCESAEKAKGKIDDVLRSKIYKRIVFPRVRDPLGDIMYRFKGEYELDQSESSYEKGLIWKRTSEHVKTYSAIKTSLD